MKWAVRRELSIATVTVSVAFGIGWQAAAQAPDKTYLVPVTTQYSVEPLFSVGDVVPETSDPLRGYQMVGIPDGLAVARSRRGIVTVFMNHEFRFDATSEPMIGTPNRGAVVSKLKMDEFGSISSADRAYDVVFDENRPVGAAAQTDNSTPAFGRFCSASFAAKDAGFDKRIYFANEETDAPNTFDPRGASTVAIFDGEAHALPKLGHFAKENSLVMLGTGMETVILTLEDGPSTPDSQLYMYVGTKQPNYSTVLRRNGLDNGRLYVFASDDSSRNNEASFRDGTLQGHWVEIPNAENLSDVELEAAADAAGAFGFIRMEDGAFDKVIPRDFFFVTTGGNEAAGNKLGRVYKIRLDSAKATGPAQLEVVYNADVAIAAGEDTAISPDNLDTSSSYLMVEEGGTGPAKTVLSQKQRDLSIWRFPLSHAGTTSVDVANRLRVAVLYPPGRDGTAVGPGVWEPSGIVDASAAFGPDTWLVTVQAHPPTTAPGINTVQDGQLLLLRSQ